MSEKAVNYIQGYDDGYEDAIRKYAPKECVREVILNNYKFSCEGDTTNRCSACGATFDIMQASDFQLNYCPNCGSHFFRWVLA